MQSVRQWVVVLVVALLAGCGLGTPTHSAGPSAGDGRSASAPRAVGGDDVVYGVVPDLWAGRRLGSAEAVRRRLPYLERLGVDVLWLWPPPQRRQAGEEYAVTSFTALDESWGSPGDLRRLVDAAHARGMRVIVDVVVNHTSRRHPWFRRADSPRDPTWDYYERDAAGRPDHYFDWRHLPNLDLDHPDVRARIVGALRHWVTAYDVDGFRFDVAWGPHRRSPTFWPEVVASLRALEPDLFLLAEATGRARWVPRDGFDAGYDWRGGLGRWAWRGIWGGRTGARLGSLLRERTPAPLFRFVDNNDTGRRFADRHGLAQARRAAVVELTVPGVPTIFAGQELGIAYEPYGAGEDPPAFTDRGLLGLYRRLVRLRGRLPALQGPDLRVLRARGGQLAYLRPGDRPVVVVVHFGGARPLRLPAGARRLLGADPRVLAGRAGIAGDSVRVGPRGYAVLAARAAGAAGDRSALAPPRRGAAHAVPCRRADRQPLG
ncbi:alpha-amylase family glycosyl hydrolase [Nocardioides ferulae]|uniref:alpha-amylase family glycosyl hydrolase n=1 Tax=Nocardioides ferulae TaxID=2340821 RepID=UPI0013DDCF69|nr:alpha-amylase family glycosyl hydrolase [Nocardioides ferulae]